VEAGGACTGGSCRAAAMQWVPTHVLPSLPHTGMYSRVHMQAGRGVDGGVALVVLAHSPLAATSCPAQVAMQPLLYLRVTKGRGARRAGQEACHRGSYLLPTLGAASVRAATAAECALDYAHGRPLPPCLCRRLLVSWQES
jgi:hypothetical protein